MKTKIKTIIFDMDGTLYQIDGNSNGYHGSSLEMKVKENACDFIRNMEECSSSVAADIWDQALKDKHGASNFLSHRYSTTREYYFDKVWRISPIGIVKNYMIAVDVVQSLKRLDINLILLTAAPKLWQEAVISYINLHNHFSEIYTGAMFSNKKEVFKKLSESFPAANLLSVGDQLETDILPARELGFQTLHVHTPDDLKKIIGIVGEI